LKGDIMKEKRKLKNWVKIALLLLPEVIMIMQLFFVGVKLNEIANTPTTTIIVESRCMYD